MACIDSLHLYDYGTSILFYVTECIDGVESPIDLTTATSLTIRFTKPDGTNLDVAGSIYTGGTNGDATDGIVEYITQDGDIDQTGKWKGQVTVTTPVGKYYSTIVKGITVKDNL